MENYQKHGYNIRITIHNFQSNLDKFPENFDSYNDEWGEQSTGYERYQGWWNEHMIIAE